MGFTQTITVRASDVEPLRQLIDGWHQDQHGVAPGYERSRILADRGRADHWVVEVDFSSEEEAQRNNDRPETQTWANDLRELAEGEPEYHDYDVVFATS